MRHNARLDESIEYHHALSHSCLYVQRQWFVYLVLYEDGLELVDARNECVAPVLRTSARYFVSARIIPPSVHCQLGLDAILM